MTQPAVAEIPAERRLEATLNLQRKAALAWGKATDHAGRVRIARMDDFDMGKTIFGGLEGALPRLVMRDKLAKDVFWSDPAVMEIEAAYAASEADRPAPPVDQRLIDFMVDECDFSMEHADGTFLEHLAFCHDYSAKYFPEHSPNVALLHSILGTATNTFAMEASKIPKLKTLLTDFEALQVEVFPSTLRLFYDRAFFAELQANLHRIDQLEALHLRRVIDNAPLVIDADNLWINLNFHLMHFIDFMPAANWGAHRADPLMMMFEALSDLLDAAGQRRAEVAMAFPKGPQPLVGERPTVAGVVSELVPPKITLGLARKTIRKYSDKIGHDLSYRLEWR